MKPKLNTDDKVVFTSPKLSVSSGRFILPSVEMSLNTCILYYIH